MYTTKLTTQGTITLPAALRRKYGLKAGNVLTIEDLDTLVIHKVPNIADVRARNAHLLTKRTRTLHSTYKTGNGLTAHVREKYGR